MTKFKSIFLTILLITTSIACTVTTSAAVSATKNDVATIYINDTSDDIFKSISLGAPITAKVGDILEIAVTAKATSDIVDFSGLHLSTYINQESPDGLNEYSTNNVLNYTNKYYSDNTYYRTFSTNAESTIINPVDLPSDRSEFVYTMSNIKNIGNFTETQNLYTFTVKVENTGDCYIHTVVYEVDHLNSDYTFESDTNLLDIHTTVNPIIQTETTSAPTTSPTTAPTTIPTTVPTTEPITEPAVPIPTVHETIVPPTESTEPSTTATSYDITEPTEPTDIKNSSPETKLPTTVATPDTATPDSTKNSKTTSGLVATGDSPFVNLAVLTIIIATAIIIITKRKQHINK